MHGALSRMRVENRSGSRTQLNTFDDVVCKVGGPVPNRGKRCFTFEEMICTIHLLYLNLAEHAYAKLR